MNISVRQQSRSHHWRVKYGKRVERFSRKMHRQLIRELAQRGWGLVVSHSGQTLSIKVGP